MASNNDVNSNKKNQNEKKKSFKDKFNSFIKNIKSKLNVVVGKRDEPVLNAEETYFRTKYDGISSLEEYITAAQRHISLEIRRNIIPNAYANNTENNFRSYYTTIDFDEDMSPYADKIFKPFKENGFKFIPLHDHIDELKNISLWLISWDKRNSFKK